MIKEVGVPTLQGSLQKEKTEASSCSVASALFVFGYIGGGLALHDSEKLEEADNTRTRRRPSRPAPFRLCHMLDTE